MKKTITMLFAMLVSVAMWAAQTYFYSGEGNGTNWTKTAMTVSEDGYYEYYEVTSTTTHKFKIGTSSNQWAYNYSYVSAGFNGTNVTNIGDYGKDNCYCWQGSAHYILVYYPNTTVNTSSSPKICASTTLPKEEEEEPTPPAPAEKDSIYFVNVYDWATPTAHLWDGTATGTTWPGMELSNPIGKSSNGHDVYKIVADKGAYTKCIFSNNGANQTADLAWTSKKYFYKKKWYDTLPVIKTVKLIPNTDWKSADAKFAAWIWGEGLDGEWTEFFTGTDTMSVEFNAAADSIDFVRLNSSVEEPKWNEKEGDNFVWNEAKDTIDYAGLTYSITGWTSGTWKPYIPEVPVSYYATGNTALVTDGGSESGAWNAQAFKTYTDTLIISGLKTGVDYALKVCPDGVLDGDHLGKGYSDLTVHTAGLTHDGDNNICFQMATAGTIQIVYKSDVFKLLGDFYVKPVEKKIVKLVPSEEWADANAKFAAWIWGSKIEAHWTSFFTPISEGNDTLQAEIISTADSIDFVRFSPKAKEPTWDKQGDYVVVWNEAKDTIDWKGLTATIKGWGELSWKPVEVPCSGFGLLVDGETYIDGKHDLSKDWTEYYLRSVHLTKGQTLKIKNKCNSDAWVITKFAETSYELEIKDGSYVIAEDGDYDFYIKLINENDEIFISKAGTYTTAVRPQCTDVMIQAFYNESYNESAAGVDVCGKTRWWNFLNEKAEDGVTSLAEEMGHYFDLVWLPPSAYGSGMGYHPKKYSDQNSTWGTWDELASLIGTLHSAGSKVVADIVINHCEGWTSWCDFPMLDFGEYGTFSPDQSYICQNDEVNGEWNKDKAGLCYGTASGSYDDGENWDGARDWSHNDVYVQNMFKAYLKWMRNVVGYDGFRYDKGDGFNNWHHDNYNKAAGPYIAFMECYSNTDEIWWRIQQANYNLMGLDFDTKWHVFDAFAGWDYDGKYGKPRGDGLLGRNNGRYAVEFIDSHDWFGRGNGCEFGGDGNSLKQELLPRLLVANAFMLSMPGVPCVFYPHWAKYKGFLKNMIDARKLAGVHSESEVKDEYFDENGYQATIVGKDGFLILCLGNKAHQNFEGFNLMSSYYAENDCNSGKDGSHQIWVKRTTPLPTGLENEDKSDVLSLKGEKFVKDGKLYIRLGEKVYDILGQTIK